MFCFFLFHHCGKCLQRVSVLAGRVRAPGSHRAQDIEAGLCHLFCHLSAEPQFPAHFRILVFTSRSKGSFSLTHTSISCELAQVSLGCSHSGEAVPFLLRVCSEGPWGPCRLGSGSRLLRRCVAGVFKSRPRCLTSKGPVTYKWSRPVSNLFLSRE